MPHGGAWLDALLHALTLFRRDHEAVGVRRVDPLCPTDSRGYLARYRGDSFKGARQL